MGDERVHPHIRKPAADRRYFRRPLWREKYLSRWPRRIHSRLRDLWLGVEPADADHSAELAGGWRRNAGAMLVEAHQRGVPEPGTAGARYRNLDRVRRHCDRVRPIDRWASHPLARL